MIKTQLTDSFNKRSVAFTTSIFYEKKKGRQCRLTSYLMNVTEINISNR